MSREIQRLPDYLSHITVAIERIAQYVHGMGLEEFLGNALVQDAVIRNLEIIGEASHKIACRFPEFAAAHPELPLVIAYQMRNALSHGYFSVDLTVVWTTVRNDLADLNRRVLRALGEVKDLPPP